LRNCKQKRKKSCGFNNYFDFYSVYLSKRTGYSLLYICAREEQPLPQPSPRGGRRKEKEAHPRPLPLQRHTLLAEKGRRGGKKRGKRRKMHKCLVICKELYNFAAKFV
jgi:hypothetical protein